ncbi:hypothetical protein KSP40_PGU001605 [Platanthera guangdongensis]|uniref:Uncharacterized protein n=1 Tax=Platanthera guangdongensis TaxID=2320717 RepID=A0ABR2LCN3_9ASPA
MEKDETTSFASTVTHAKLAEIDHFEMFDKTGRDIFPRTGIFQLIYELEHFFYGTLYRLRLIWQFAMIVKSSHDGNGPTIKRTNLHDLYES